MYTWPDNLCSGRLRYGRANNYDGFYLADAAHGIPTIGAVFPPENQTIHGHRADLFNYPKQTEDIARRLVACWNACVGESIEDLEK